VFLKSSTGVFVFINDGIRTYVIIRITATSGSHTLHVRIYASREKVEYIFIFFFRPNLNVMLMEIDLA